MKHTALMEKDGDGTGDGSGAGSTRTFTQDELNAAVANVRREHKDKLDAITKERDDAVALRTQLEERHKETEAKLGSTSKEALKFKVALDAGLPAVLAERLTGDDEDSLKSDAAKLKELIKVPSDGGGKLVGGPTEEGAPEPTANDMNARIRRAAGRE